ncbi:MAG: hypothetical protein R3B09_25920 [Nannocystaceae bacterium]
MLTLSVALLGLTTAELALAGALRARRGLLRLRAPEAPARVMPRTTVTAKERPLPAAA